jgi:hypothetical protein
MVDPRSVRIRCSDNLILTGVCAYRVLSESRTDGGVVTSPPVLATQLYEVADMVDIIVSRPRSASARMNPEANAQRVAEIAHALAYRQRHQIAHSSHTVRRLLLAVSVLVGRRVTFEDGSTPPGYLMPQTVTAPKRELK